MAVLLVVQVDGRADARQVAVQRRHLGVVGRRAQLGHHDGRNDGQDDDHDEQFHEGETALATPGYVMSQVLHGFVLPSAGTMRLRVDAPLHSRYRRAPRWLE